MADPTLHLNLNESLTATVTFLQGGAAADPETVTAKTRKPDGTITTYVYGVDDELVKAAVGVYVFTFTLSAAGLWRWRVEGGGSAEQGVVVCDPDPFDPDYSAPPSSWALCTLEEFKNWNGIEQNDESWDDLICDLIDDASAAILNYIGIEVRPWVENPSTHVFDLESWHVEEQLLPVGALADTTDLVVELHDQTGTLTQTAAAGAVVALPRNRKPWEPICELWFPSGATTPFLLSRGYTASVTGNWGYPAVPSDLRRYAVVQASTWYARDVSKWSATFNLVETRVERARTLSDAIREGLDDAYRIPSIG